MAKVGCGLILPTYMTSWKARVGNTDYLIEKDGKAISVNGKAVEADLLKTVEGQYHLLLGGKGHRVEILEIDKEAKTIILLVNGQKKNVQLSDKYDELLKQMGMGNAAAAKSNQVKAPMPGLVLRLMVENGQAIAKGDSLLILEAMKMENVLKASAAGVIKLVKVAEKDKVEKNQVLIELV